ncbi:MAG TPA: thiol:disulfide interchange protein DsbA/DsbL [Paucimonas sp.]|nr:thiol:disulfide interchange protein DsbA/DsbL [Paucimonas sp.]
MRFLQHVLAAISLSVVALTAGATPANPQNGVDYLTLDKPQQTDSGKKIEVTEFFSYACPHCSAFEPVLEAWVKKQGEAVVFKRVPVGFHRQWVPLQKLYFALEAMNKTAELQQKVFHAIHEERQQLFTDSDVADFVAKNGIDRKKFLDVYNSFSVQAKVNRAQQLLAAYGIDGVPTVAIDGRFITSPSIVGAALRNQPESALMGATAQVMDWLVAKVAKEHKK